MSLLSNLARTATGRRALAIASILIALSGPAFADAVTYVGTLGNRAIVLELTEPGDGPLLGRYSDQSNGADIPLHPLDAGPAEIVLAAEAPCTPALCVRADGNLVLDPPLAGQFALHLSTDGERLTGTWRASTTGSELPVILTRFGQRAYTRDEVFPYAALPMTGDEPISALARPYEYAKMQVALDTGPLQTFSGATYVEVTDPRTKFAFPRLVSLPGGGDVAPINAALDQRRWGTALSGMECLSRDYLSGGWMPAPFGNATTSLGGVDQEKVVIDYLSDTVMTLRQQSHSSCGGGDPYDDTTYLSYDVRAGRPIDLSQIFSGWDAATDAPTQPMFDWLLAAYRKSNSYDAAFDASCLAGDDPLAEIHVSFAQNETAVFRVDNAEDAGCSGDLVSVPLADIPELLAGTAADFFPSLK